MMLRDMVKLALRRGMFAVVLLCCCGQWKAFPHGEVRREIKRVYIGPRLVFRAPV